MTDKLESLLTKLMEYYTLLTGTPEPEQEEDSQKKLIPLLEEIKAELEPQSDKFQCAEDLHNIVKNWDTLEQWFNEVEGLKEKMKDFLGKCGKGQEKPKPPVEQPSVPKESPEDILRKQYEAKMKELEEKERLLREKEELLLKQKTEKETPAPTPTPAVNMTKMIHTAPVEQPAAKVVSKLAPPEIKIPKLMAPKITLPAVEEKTTKDAPSAVIASVESNEMPPVEESKIPPVEELPIIKAPTANIEEPVPEIEPPAAPIEEPPAPEPAVETPPEAVPPVIAPKPQVKINIGAGAPTPIKINPNPIKISVPTSDQPGTPVRPRIKPMTADNVVKPHTVAPSPVPAAEKPIIKPVGGNTPIIQPVNAVKPNISPASIDRPVIKPVASVSSIQPVSAIKPVIQPVSDEKPVIKPVTQTPSAPAIRPIGNVQTPSIRPIGEVSRPAIRPIGDVQRPNITPIEGNESRSAAISQNTPVTPTPTRGANLFAQKSGERKPVNLFEQKSKSGGEGNASESQSSGVNEPGKIQKVGALERIDYQAKAIEQGVVSNEDESLLKLPPEQLYHELLKTEAKRFYFDRNLTALQQNFEKGQIPEADFRGARERLKFELDQVMEKMQKIRTFLIPTK